MKRTVLCILSILTIVFSAQSQVWGQANITGTVTDSKGGAIARADVRLVTPQQLTLAAVKSDAAGTFRFENISPGSYLIIASRFDFAARREAIQIDSGGDLNVSLILDINQLNEEVTVTAETGLAENKSRIPYQINIIGEDTISERATGVLAQVANEEKGVTLQRTSPTIGAVLVRGLTEVGVYVDGVRYTNSTQRGGINTFFNLNEPTALGSVEIQRSPNTGQFGSDGLGGNLQLVSRQPEYGFDKPQWSGESGTFYNSSDNSFGSNLLLSYGTKRFGILTNLAARRINTLRTGGGFDSHSAISRFLGLPSNISGSDRLPDTAFTQYGGTIHLNYAPRDDQQISFRYQRSQQDGGKRYDQLLGGDGNLIANLRNLMLDFGYLRYFKQGAGFFDNFSANVSFNSQREERVNQGGQGNPISAIGHDKERTTSWGTSFYLDKRFSGNNFLVGGDYYYDRVSAPSFETNPQTGSSIAVRPRVPNGATYKLGGLYIQDSFEAIPERLRLSGALRYNIGIYESRAANAPILGGVPLFPDDSLRVGDFSGRIGAVATIAEGLNLGFNFSRGFRAPNITNLGSLGLVGVGFQVSTTDVAGLGATIGTTADANAVSSGNAVEPLRSEISNNYDVSLRYKNRHFEASFAAFLIDYANVIVRQTLILPPGAVGQSLGSQTIAAQNANGAVFVPLSTSPVLVQANFGDSRLNGAEADFKYRFAENWVLAGNYSFVRAEDRATGEPPNLGGGGIPPQFGLLRLRYQPAGGRFWLEGVANLTGRQDRLSTLDLGDRRTGAARSRAQIRNFFRRGACVRGLTTPGTNGQCGSDGGILIATGETLLQLQNRLLPIGSSVNGVFIIDDNTSVPLFDQTPGYVLFNIRGGYRISENQQLNLSLENITDKNYRAPGWGIDGPGRSFQINYRLRF